MHAGIDTLSLAWRAQGGSEVMSAIARQPHFRQGRGCVVADSSPAGLRVMAWPDHGLVAAEGRLAAAVDCSSDSTRLAGLPELQEAEAAFRSEIRALLGHEPPDDAHSADPECRRYDLCTERRFSAASDGLAFMRALGAMHPPRLKLQKIENAAGLVETVYAITPKRGRKLFRAYDKGLESGSDEAGTRIRLEAQRRPTKDQRRRPETLARRNLGAEFSRTFAPFLEGESITVTHSNGVVDHLAEKVARDELSIARAERLAGSIEFLRRYGRSIYASDSTSARRLRQLREAGIVVDDELPEASTLPVSDLLTEMVESFDAT